MNLIRVAERPLPLNEPAAAIRWRISQRSQTGACSGVAADQVAVAGNVGYQLKSAVPKLIKPRPFHRSGELDEAQPTAAGCLFEAGSHSVGYNPAAGIIQRSRRVIGRGINGPRSKEKNIEVITDRQLWGAGPVARAGLAGSESVFKGLTL